MAAALRAQQRLAPALAVDDELIAAAAALNAQQKLAAVLAVDDELVVGAALRAAVDVEWVAAAALMAQEKLAAALAVAVELVPEAALNAQPKLTADESVNSPLVAEPSDDLWGRHEPTLADCDQVTWPKHGLLA